MQLKISGYSTALFSTWYFVEEWGLLFDAGDGVTASLLQKGGKVRNAFISHADRDHLTGLLQFNQLNARHGLPTIHYPKDCKSFPHLAEFFDRFDPHTGGTVWKPIRAGFETEIKKGLMVSAFRNEHVPAAPEMSKSLSYRVDETKRKLKAEYVGRSSKEMAELRKTVGQEGLTKEVRNRLLGYSGDTPVRDFSHWDGVQTLIHEATFIDSSYEKPGRAGNLHSTLNEVLEAVSGIEVGQLILGHFSSRYGAAEIDMAIVKSCHHYRINCPVYRIWPGQTRMNILGHQPLYQPEG